MKYSQLPESDSEKSSESEWPPAPQGRQHNVPFLLQTGVFVLLLISNVGWILTLWSIPPRPVGIDEYPPHKTIHTAVFQDTTYGDIGAKKPQADSLWRDLFPSGNGLVSVSKSDREAHGLSETWPDPDTPGNGLFFMAGYHNLHCLAKIRTSVFQSQAQKNQSEPWAHVVHCIDQIRQTIMCNIDTTLVPMSGPKEFIDGHYHVCKDYRDVFEWASQHRPVVAPEDEEAE
ncbi:hypothetical protein DL95DRAFT_332213 [Leptodontidium sp. 2 PMI_412]|nr:hypothetical protein BKA61DRAFT_295373 [Leptodontidium sp. MPI-SDFR-AT-0119]KAH9218505.1 hypothetical protein DL95DRAFT_332213 [Leptodontidium sp. 2 PMI_412]